MKIVIGKPLLPPLVKEIDGILESMQNIVGGTIQALYPFNNPEIALVCNDDGSYSACRLIALCEISMVIFMILLPELFS